MSLVPRDMASQGNENANDEQRLQLAQRSGSYSHKNGVESREYNPPSASFSKPGSANDRNNNGLADFFSTEVFQIVLHNPTTAHRLLKFSQARMCGENMEFLEKVSRRGVDCICMANTEPLTGGPLQHASRRVGHHNDRHTSLLHCHRSTQADRRSYQCAEEDQCRHQSCHYSNSPFDGIDLHRGARQRREHLKNGSISTFCQVSDDQQRFQSFIYGPYQISGVGGLLLPDRSKVRPHATYNTCRIELIAGNIVKQTIRSSLPRMVLCP